MAVRTFYLNGASTYFVSVVEGYSVGQGYFAMGWKVGKTSPPAFSYFTMAGENTTFIGSAYDVAPAAGSGNAIYMGPFTGDFAAGNWNIYTKWIAVSNGGALDGRILFSVWRSTNLDASGATRIGTGQLVGSTFTNLDTGAAQHSDVVWNAPALNLNNEYLFFALELEILGAGGNANADCDFYYDSVNSPGAKIVTSDWIVPVTASGSLPTATVTTVPDATVSLASVQLYSRTLTGVGL